MTPVSSPDNFYFRLQSCCPTAGLAGQTSEPAESPPGDSSGGKIRGAGPEPGWTDSSARRPLPRPAAAAETTAEAVHTTGGLPSPGCLAELSTE